jgi:hypothetical protein
MRVERRAYQMQFSTLETGLVVFISGEPAKYERLPQGFKNQTAGHFTQSDSVQFNPTIAAGFASRAA